MPLTPDLSVYQLALDNLAVSQSLKVSVIALKSLVGALIDVLIEETISATVWVKLPSFEDWQVELKRYQQVRVPQTIYLCSSVGDKLAEFTDKAGQSADANTNSHIFPIQLAAGSQLKREYFLIVLSDRLNGLFVAYQPDAESVEGQGQPLLAVCTFEQQVIQLVLESIRGAIAVTDTTPDEVLERWETECPVVLASNETNVLSQLLVKQLQRTEKMLHSPALSAAQGECNPMHNGATDTSKLDNTSSFATASLPLTDVCELTPTTNNNKDLHAQDEFLKRVAQELRTPLTNMKTALKLLDAPHLKPPQRQRYMELLNRECDRQNSLISGMLEFVQLNNEPQPSVMPSMQLTDIVPGIVSTYQPIAQEKGIQLGYTIPAGLPVVSCIETWLRVIVINLLSNSLKFTPTGGQVRVRVTLQGDYIQLAFEDTGIGIASSEIPKIFDSFYRGRSTTGENTGAGLGLTMVQQLLLRCGGSISVISKLGEGSNFKVLLPVAHPTFTGPNC